MVLASLITLDYVIVLDYVFVMLVVVVGVGGGRGGGKKTLLKMNRVSHGFPNHAGFPMQWRETTFLGHSGHVICNDDSDGGKPPGDDAGKSRSCHLSHAAYVICSSDGGGGDGNTPGDDTAQS